MLWDAEVKGFALRITPGGAKSFILDYRAEGRQRRITIGAWPDWTVAAARQTAKDMKREVDLGHDPMGERQAQRDAPTVQEMWERYGRRRTSGTSALSSRSRTPTRSSARTTRSRASA
ncbi:Arm DNA-binding domain-containing protein [Cereibacter sediminicola]|uniref:Arm DNA-binding domain-containing protein n=1 Tax=Cereibacter sediminicola TaxID=2584941 RepID=UPI001FEBEF93